MSSIEGVEPVSRSAWLDIEALIYEVARLVDSGQADQVHSFFAEDAVVGGAGPHDLIGRTAIREWGEARVRLGRHSRHVVSNMAIAGLGVGRARVTAYLTLYRHDGDLPGSPMPFMVGDCIDDVTRDEQGRWLIAERRVITIFAADPSAALQRR